MLAVRLASAGLVRRYLDGLPLNLGTQPELSFVRPPALPGEPWLVLFGLPGPGGAKERDTESEELRIDVCESSVRAKTAAAVLPTAPYVDADVDVL